ncbi:MAG: hypothetical protein ACK41E_11080, partial [Deinococcales bacterium]
SVGITLTNSFNDAPFAPTGSNKPPSTLIVQTTFSGIVTLGFTFSSFVDLVRFEAFEPRFSLEFALPKNGAFDFGLSLSLALPNRNANFWLWENLRMSFGWDVRAGLSVFGTFNYKRTWSNTTGVFTDTFTAENFGVALALAVVGSERPNLFFVATVNQTFAFSDALNSSQNPTYLQPAFQVIFDQCCYSIVFRLAPDKSAQNYVFSLTLSLPYGNQSILTIDKDYLRLPVLPFRFEIPTPKP